MSDEEPLKMAIDKVFKDMDETFAANMKAIDDKPFGTVKVTLLCPFDDGVELTFDMGWVNHDYPMLNVNAPEIVAHMKERHAGQ